MAEDRTRQRQDRDRRDGDRDSRREGDRDRRGEAARSRLGARDAMRFARTHLKEMTGKDAEAVIRVEPDGVRGWQVALEVLELERIPNTTDLLACYELDLDEDGELVGYRRLRRYTRSEQGEEVQT